MIKEYVGLRTYLYTFLTAAAAERGRRRLSCFGDITEVFLNNAYGFELRLSRVISFEEGL